MSRSMSPESTTRQIVAGPRGKNTDVNVRDAISFILQQQGKKDLKKADMSVVDGDEHDVNQVMRRIHGAIVQESFIAEAAGDDEIAATAGKLGNSKDALAAQVAQALNRYSMVDSAEDRGMLLLIAALMLLNVSDGSSTNNGTVRRLITAGLSQMRKTKNEK